MPHRVMTNRALAQNDGGFEAGDSLPDGTIYAGISPDTHKPLYAMPTDAGQMLSWKKAGEFAAGLDMHGHKDWRVPTQNELEILYRLRHRIPGFSMTGWYWSSSLSSHGLAWVQRFSDGHQFSHANAFEMLFLRCVRG